MVKATRFVLPWALVALIGVVSCDYQEGDTGPEYTSAEEQLAAEFGAVVEQASVERVVAMSKDLIMQKRGQGIGDFIDNLRAQLTTRGIQSAALDGIHDTNLGEPLPGVGDMMQSWDGDTGSAPPGADNPNKKYWDCPPMQLTGKESCVKIIDAAVLQTKKAVDVQTFHAVAEQQIEQDGALSQETEEFKDYAKQYLGELTSKVYEFGVDAAAIRAEYTLRNAGLCDDEQVDGKEIARMRGVDDAEKILRKMIGQSNLTLAPKGEACLRIGQTGAQTQARIDAAIQQWISEQPLCPDTSRSNANVQEAEKYRKEGIDRGVKALTTTIWVGTIRKGVVKAMAQYTVVNVDGCSAKDQIRYTTSPLVIDLDGDGLDLSTDRVSFDLLATGQPQKVTWPGPTEGLLALDLNHDGRITSGRELFGNRTYCGNARCADGAEALAAHDSNNDRRIDKNDPAFSELRIWVDHDRDGRCRPAEVTTLADHGIKSLSLEATPLDRVVPAGRISLSLSVQTETGQRTAYDVWFDNLVSPGFPTPLQ